jgi:hypothetical protein
MVVPLMLGRSTRKLKPSLAGWRSSLTGLALPLAGWLIAACASGPRAKPAYPPRKPGCALTIFHTDLPGVAAWDDLGTVEVICHVDDMEATCFSRVRAEACRMGGDIIYHMPVKPWRPKDEAIGYRGRVAHRRAAPVKEEVAPDPSLPPPATAEESAGPVIPLTGPAAPAPVAPTTSSPSPPAAAPDAGAAGNDASGAGG